MMDFRLDRRGDVVLDGDIALVSGADLAAQKVRTVLGTNRGEWFLGPGEGIRFRSLLGRGVGEDQVRDEIQAGLRQVDGAYLLTDCTCTQQGRGLTVRFTAQNGNGETIKEAVTIADG